MNFVYDRCPVAVTFYLLSLSVPHEGDLRIGSKKAKKEKKSSPGTRARVEKESFACQTDSAVQVRSSESRPSPQLAFASFSRSHSSLSSFLSPSLPQSLHSLHTPIAMSPPSSSKHSESGVARLCGSGTSGFLELMIFHPIDTVAKRLMSNQTRVSGDF